MNARPSVLRPPASRLYAIVDTGFFGSEPAAVTGAVRTLLDCGVRWIQLRAKGVPDLAAWRLAEAVGRVFEEAPGDGAEEDAPVLWINDSAAIAAALLANGPQGGLRVGLHLGQDDLPPAAARRAVPPACPIGRSTHGREQAEEAESDPAVDALAIGPVFGTTTKERPDPVVGLVGVAEAREVTSKPLIGIGGIDAEGAPRVVEAGADAVAVVSALDPAGLAASCRLLLRALA
ncbi:MAG: thiamine phosphate synthase [Holophagales bacterium]|nr:thiamine phosphate synthase [Holophagales bacterium]MYH24455.1 thiamine phosphate synthase [Holophagales bacterium]